MSTDITVTTTAHVAVKRGWLWGEHGTEPGTMPSITLDLSLFTAATHYPEGHIPSGIVLAKVTATGLYGPYDEEATDGRDTAAGLLWNAVTVKPGVATTGDALFVHGFVDPARLPFQSGTGSLGDDGQDALTLIYWA